MNSKAIAVRYNLCGPQKPVIAWEGLHKYTFQLVPFVVK